MDSGGHIAMQCQAASPEKVITPERDMNQRKFNEQDDPAKLCAVVLVTHARRRAQ